MINFLKNNQKKIFLGICLGIFLGLALSIISPNLLSANLSIPYGQEESGLPFQKQDSSGVILEGAPDQGSRAINDILYTIFSYLKIVMAILGTMWLVWAGVYMVSSAQNEDNSKKGKKMVIYAIIAYIFAFLIEPLVLDIIYGGRSVSVTDQGINTPEIASSNLRLQIDGLLYFLKSFLVFITMLFLMISGARMIFAWGEEEGISNAKKMIPPIFIGFLVTVFNEFFIDFVIYNIFFDGQKVNFNVNGENANAAIVQIISFLSYILGFLILAMVAYFIYGGFRYITSFGNEEGPEAAKKILMHASIGIVILLLSYVLMYSLVNFDLG